MHSHDDKGIPHTTPRQSATFSADVNSDIRRAAATGIYDIRGGGAKRKVPSFDDLLFMGASISRYTDHHRGHVFWCPIRPSKRSFGPRCIHGGHINDDW